jgi:peroxiredoxin
MKYKLLVSLLSAASLASLTGCRPRPTAARDDSITISQQHVYSSRFSAAHDTHESKGAATKGATSKGKTSGVAAKKLAPKIAIGATVPDFSFTALDGTAHQLSQWRGKMPLFIVADTTCPCVKAYNDRMKALSAKYEAQGLQVIYFFPSPVEGRDRIEKFVKTHEYPWVTTRDDSQHILRLLDAQCTTEAFLLDRDGKLRYHGRIDDSIYVPEEVKSRDLENAVQSLIDGKAIAKAEIPAYGCTIPRLTDSSKPNKKTKPSAPPRKPQEKIS